MKVLRLHDVMEKTGLRHTLIYDMIKKGTFPDRVRLTERAVGWLESEIDEWIANRVAERDADNQ